MAISKITPNADYIVEQGTSGIWTYRKWASGVAECWGEYSGDNEPLTTPAAPFTSYWLKDIAYPFTFTENGTPKAPVVTSSARIGNGYAVLGRDYGYSDQVRVLYYTSMSTATTTVRATFYIIGKWK